MPIKIILEKQGCHICDVVKHTLIIPYNIFSRLYIFIFARPSMQRFNNKILDLALRSRGYNNCCDTKSTGEEIFLQLLAKHNPKLCVDIGANKGHYSERLLNLTSSKVIAFEPLPKAFEILNDLQVKFPDRFVVINKGVGDKNADLDLYFGKEDSEFASFSKEINEIDYVRESNKNTIKAEVITLDGFIYLAGYGNISEVDLLKIDTEGYEYEVLVGAEKMLKDMKPKFIQIEYNWHQLFKNKSLFKLASLLPGYVAYQLLPYGTGLSKIDVRKPESNIYHYSNFVFVRNDISI
jgi:FkbM family methyltransferase